MGGEIGVESDSDGRISFWFEIELSPPVNPDSAPGDAPAPRTRRHRAPLVLVIDDSPINQVVAARTLERCGCRADIASDSASALEALALTGYDAVMIECQNPAQDTTRVIAELRRKDRLSGKHTPVIAMSVSATAGEQKRWLGQGMDAYVAKPLRRKALAETLERLVPGRRRA
jgi:CheY-like chemotaxis protein